MNRLQLLALTVLSGILLPMALPNDFFMWGSPLFGLIALIPLFIALSLSPSPRFGFLLGCLYGAIFHGISAYWLWFFKGYRIWTIGSTTLAYAVIYAGVCAWLSLAARSSTRLRPLFLVFGWVAYEFMKSIGFLAFPYGLIAYSWNRVDLFNQIADQSGLFGPSLILALCNSLGSELFLRFLEKKSAASIPTPRAPHALSGPLLIRYAAIVASCFALSLGYGAIKLANPTPSTKTLKAVLVQPAADSWVERSESNRLSSIMDLTDDALAMGSEKPDIVFWTETTLDWPYDHYADSYYSRLPKNRPLKTYLEDLDIPLMTGLPKVLSWDPPEASNSVAIIDKGGRYVDYYAKMHPVPFAEAIPFWEYQWMRDFMEAAVGMTGGWTTGERVTLFSLPLSDGQSLRFAAPICFEISFANQCREFCNYGAEALVNLTNVSWSQRESAQIQHCVTAVYRAIENRRTVIQSTNAGVSCWVDAQGRIHDALPMFVPASVYSVIPIQSPRVQTVYSSAGDFIAWLTVIVFALGSALLILRVSAENFSEIRRIKALGK